MLLLHSFLLLSSGAAHGQGSAATDRAALVALYNATGGAGWIDNTNWLSDRPLGEWHGVFTDSGGRVRMLDLSRNGLSGTIPLSLVNVSKLYHLDLSRNDLFGWNDDLGGNGIPPNPSLEYVLLSGNRLTGPIPIELAGFSGLKTLNLADNLFDGPIPHELGNLTELQALYLGSNRLTGTIPDTLRNLRNLVGISLRSNRLSGPIPAYFGDLPNLETLELNSNNFTGPIPREFGRLSRLWLLNLHENRLSGSIPPELGQLSRLQHLVLFANRLSGAVPATFGQLTNLQTFYVHGNEVCLPPALEAWHAALDHSIDISACSGGGAPSFGGAGIADQHYRSGTAVGTVALPEAAGGAQPVSYSLAPALPAGLRFDRSARTITGTPTAASAARSYTYTARDANGRTASLTFTIAVSAAGAVPATDREALVALYHAAGGAGWTRKANWLGGRPLREWHGVTTDAAGRVTGLNLSGNGLSGSLPPALGRLTGLRYLFIYNNAGLSGPLPAEIGGLSGLTSFYAFGTGLCLPASVRAWHAAIQRKGSIAACTGDEVPAGFGFGTQTVSAQSYAAGSAIAALTLPAAQGGAQPVSYSLAPALPAGLRFDRSARTITGTPTAASAARSYTYTARDAGGRTASLTFTIAVSAAGAVPATDREALVALYHAAGGAGWTRKANWLGGRPLREWHGVTTDAAGRVTGLNLSGNGLSGSLPPALGRLTGLRYLFIYNNPGLSGPLPAEIGGLSGLTSFYAFGTGLCLPASVRAWHAAIQRKGSIAACTGDEVPAGFGFGTQTVSAQSYAVGSAIAALTLPAAQGGAQPVSYSLTPALPVGLGFNRSTRVVSGIPLAASAARSYTYTARDAGGRTASLTFTIAVSAAGAVPATDREALVALYHAAGGAGWTRKANWLGGRPLREWHGVTTDAAGRVTGLNLSGNGLSGSLPPALGRLTGLRYLFIYNNPGLSGPLPAEIGGLSGLTSFYAFGTGLCLPASVRAWHAAIQRKGSIAACTGDEVPAGFGFGTQTVSAQSYAAGSAIAALTLPAAQGGAQPVSYSLTPALPVGLGFNRSTRVVSGIPLAASAARSYTYTARDAGGRTASLTFTIAVSAAGAVPATDREALVALYHAAGGAGWTRKANWLGDRPLREWHGVTTDAAGRVTGLNLSGNGLSGSLPPALGRLTGLRYLFIYNNPGLSGPLPAEIGRLSGLTSFYAFGTGLCLPASVRAWHTAIQRKGSIAACTGDEVPAGFGFGTQTIAERCYTEGVPRPGIVLPAATGGVGAVTYSLTPALPSGLRFDPATRTLSGTLGGNQIATTSSRWYSHTARDAVGETATLSFTITTVKGAVDREALVAIYEATDGPNWTSRSNWLSHCAPIGQWKGVTALFDRVTALDLSFNRLAGKLPVELADLDALETLDLSDNAPLGGLTGPIPSQLGSLSRLTKLDLSGNILTGSIPGALGNLGRLQELNLSDNRLTGAIPSALSRLGNLEALDVSGNRLSGALPASLGTLARLVSLKVGGTGLSGFLPASLTNLRLRSFLTSGTGLCLPEGMVDWYLGIGEHDYLDFKEVPGGYVEYSPKDSCDGQLSFDGRTIPGQSYQVGTAIPVLTLPEATGGTGTLSYQLTPALPVGLSFDGQTRTISGTPTQQHGATVYSYTARHENGKTATLTFAIAVTAAAEPPPVPPPGGGATDREILVAFYHATGGPNWKNNTNWLSDKELDDWYGVKDNLLCLGPCDPASIAAARVTGLYLADNGLTGSIPAAIGNLSELGQLWLNKNRLTGPIPPEIGNLARLYDLALSENSLTGPIPPEIGNLASLERLALDQNSLTGALPPELGKLSRLKDLYLILNGFTGRVPEEWINMSSLEYLGIDFYQDVCVPQALRSWWEKLDKQYLTIPFCSVAASFATATAGQSRAAERSAITETLAVSASALLSSVTDSVRTRISAPRGSSLVIGGHDLRFGRRAAPFEDRGSDGAARSGRRESRSVVRSGEWEDLLYSSGFSVDVDADETGDGARLTAWGRATQTAFAGEAVRSGELDIGWAGMDARLGEYWRAGFAASHAQIDADYQSGAGSGAGRLRMTLTGMYPWLRFSPDGKMEAWMLTGFGQGKIHNAPADATGYETGDLSAWVASLGGRRSVAWWDGFDVALVGDAGIAHVETGDGRGVADSLSADVWRVRFSAEASWTVALDGETLATPFLDIAARHDRDLRDRYGIEASGGVRLSAPSMGLDVEARGRTLQLHSDRQHDEWGANLTARLAPRDEGKGLSLSVSPTWGISSRKADALRRDDVFGLADGLRAAPGKPFSLDTRAEYGVTVPVGTVTPFGEFGLRGADDRRLRLGVRLASSAAAGRALDLEFVGERHERGGRETGHGVSLTGRLRF